MNKLDRLEQRLRDAAIELAQALEKLRDDRNKWHALKVKHHGEGVCSYPPAPGGELCEDCEFFRSFDLYKEHQREKYRCVRRIVTAYAAMVRNEAALKREAEVPTE